MDFFFSFTLMKECHETIRILEREKTTLATFFHFLFFMRHEQRKTRHHYSSHLLGKGKEHFEKCLQTGFNRTKVTDCPTCTFKAGQSAHRVTPDASHRPVANHDTLHWFTKKSTQCLSLLSVQWGNQVIPSTLKQPMTVQNHWFGR